MQTCIYCGYVTDGVVELEHSEAECLEMQEVKQSQLDDEPDPDDDCRTHGISCECEDCMQTYPERFDEDWNNIHRTED